jgi:hypothetical protein
MPLKAIDVAIGMAFLYLLLTLIASALVELVSTVRNWRGQMLSGGVHKLLRGTIVRPQDFCTSPFIEALARMPRGRSWRKFPALPAYIPATAFSNAVVSLLWKQCVQRDPDLAPASPEDTARAIGRALTGRRIFSKADESSEERRRHKEAPLAAETDALRVVVETALATEGPSIQGVRQALEKWYNEAMDRLTGDYKRRTQAWLLGIGVLGSFTGNIDSINVVKWLWAGDAARQAVVASAAEFSKSHRSESEAAKQIDQAKDDEARKNAIDKQLTAMAADVATASEALTSSQFPFGWHRMKVTLKWLLQYVIGCLVSGIAISVGSTFWFDALQALVKIRGTGPRPTTR